MKKSLESLNKKWWYRLFKVIYILFFIVFTWFWIAVLGDHWIRELNYNKTQLICLEKDGTSSYLTKENHTYKLSEVWNIDLDYRLFDDSKLEYSNLLTYKTEQATDIVIFCINKLNPDEIRTNNDLDSLIYQKARELKYWKNKLVLIENMKSELDTYINSLWSYPSSYTKGKGLDFSLQIFDIKPHYSYTSFILYSILTIIWIYLWFEFLRRVFYYIFLWSFFPKE